MVHQEEGHPRFGQAPGRKLGPGLPAILALEVAVGGLESVVDPRLPGIDGIGVKVQGREALGP